MLDFRARQLPQPTECIYATNPIQLHGLRISARTALPDNTHTRHCSFVGIFGWNISPRQHMIGKLQSNMTLTWYSEISPICPPPSPPTPVTRGGDLIIGRFILVG